MLRDVMFLIARKCAMLILSGSNKAVQKCCPPNIAIKPIEPKQDVLIHSLPALQGIFSLRKCPAPN